jgi:hypothetical protein
LKRHIGKERLLGSGIGEGNIVENQGHPMALKTEDLLHRTVRARTILRAYPTYYRTTPHSLSFFPLLLFLGATNWIFITQF